MIIIRKNIYKFRIICYNSIIKTCPIFYAIIKIIGKRAGNLGTRIIPQNRVQKLACPTEIYTTVIISRISADSAVQNPPQVYTPIIETTFTLPTNVLPIDMKKDSWHYFVNKDGFGVLCHSDMCLIAWNINDYYVTPWGQCFWQNVAGWQFVPAKGPEG